MPPKLFFDSSALISGAISANGAARALLVLAEAALVTIVVSEQVVVETERALARKASGALPYYREALRLARLQIVRDPTPTDVLVGARLISHPPDVSIVLAAMRAEVDYLVTLNRRHFIDDPNVAQRSGLRVGTPGDALAWVRQYFVRLNE